MSRMGPRESKSRENETRKRRQRNGNQRESEKKEEEGDSSTLPYKVLRERKCQGSGLK